MVLVLMIFGFSACVKADDSTGNLYGRYVGIFNRTGMDTAQVSLVFTGNSFEGSTNKTNYPAICHGKFDMDGNTATFVDSCSWTANFDWSLALSGEYNINFMNGMVRIWKTDGIITDEYLLREPGPVNYLYKN